MGNYKSKPNTTTQSTERTLAEQKLMEKILYVPAHMYNFFRKDDQEKINEGAIFGIKIRDFSEMMLAYEQKTRGQKATEKELRVNVRMILENKFGIDIDGSLDQHPLLDGRLFVVPAAFINNQTMAETNEVDDPVPDNFEAIADAPPPVVRELFPESDVDNDDTKSVHSVNSAVSSVVTARSDLAPSVASRASLNSNSSINSRNPKKPKQPTVQKTAKDKVNEVLSLVLSPCRVVALDYLKNLLSDEILFDELRLAISAELDKVALTNCVLGVIRALLDTADKAKSTLNIINSVAAESNIPNSVAFTSYFGEKLVGVSDQKPLNSAADELKYNARVGTALKSKPKNLFNDFFDANTIKLGAKEKELGSTLEKRAALHIKKTCSKFLSPLCNAVIQIVRNMPSSNEISDEDRYHLIASLIYRTGVLKQKTIDVVNNMSSQTLPENVLQSLKDNKHESLPDERSTQVVTLEEERDFAYCMAYTINELPRQILKSESPDNLGKISQSPENVSISRALQRFAKEKDAEIRLKALPAIEEGTSSTESSPVKPARQSLLAESMSRALGNQRVGAVNDQEALDAALSTRLNVEHRVKGTRI